MGFMLPALPFIAQAGGQLLGGLFAKKGQKEAAQRSPEELRAMGSLNTLGGQGAQMGTSLQNQGQRSLAGPANYFQTLLQGNRGAMNQAIAGPAGMIQDQYRGAERQLEGAGLRGAGRDVALANLGRERAGKLAGLTTGIQPYAAEQLGTLGSTQLNAGQNAINTSGNIYQNLLTGGFENRKYARGEGTALGGALGKVFGDIGGAIGGAINKKWGSGSDYVGYGDPYEGR